MVNSASLVVGLGNPGTKYGKTRHNIGFRILDLLAERCDDSFKKSSKAKGELLKTVFLGKELLLLKPDTYMNLSGEAVQPVVSYYKIPLERVLIVTDDVYLPFGQIRLRPKGSSGGHNGLKNIEQMLHTNHYPRLRIGVGLPADSDMADHVLEKFSLKEEEALEEVLPKAVDAIELWLKKGIMIAMTQCNVHPNDKEKVDEKAEKKSL